MVKIAVVGAGSYVFGPSMLSQILREQKLDGVELALMDVDAEIVESMAAVGRRIASEQGLAHTRVTAQTDREAALDGADFVVCSASPQMRRRFRMDLDIIAAYAPGHVPSEFGGIAGISYTLRQIAFFEDLCADIRRWCPAAYLLNVANPLPRVMQAVNEIGVRGVGFCSVAVSGYDLFSRLLYGEGDRYPYARARERFRIKTAGLNHHAFALEVTDPASGEDLLPTLRRRVCEEGRSAGNPRSERLLCETGFPLLPGDDHTRDFFPPHPGDVSPGHLETWHGSDDQRAARLQELRAYAEGTGDEANIFSVIAWERPGDLIAALRFGRSCRFEALNLPNAGQIPELPNGIIVETPAMVTEAEGIVAEVCSLPEPVVPYCLRTATVTDRLVRAALEGDRVLLAEVVERDPTITDKAAGCRAVKALLAAHSDLLPRFG